MAATPTQAPLGTGLARKAANTIEADKLYKKYVIDAQMNGEDPLTKEDFLKKMMDDQQTENDSYKAEMKA